MLCFLCSFAKGGYCYCRPGRPVTVVSTMDMIFVDTSFPTAAAVTRRRARSLPVRRKECSQFVRFRSLREAKPERRDRRRPFRVEVVSIASSAESKLRRRRTMRERARQRLEDQLPPSSSSSSLHSMASEDLQPLVIDRPQSHSASEDSGEEMTTSIELAMATESPSRSSFAVLVNGTQVDGTADSDDLPPSDPEDSVLVRRTICPTVIDRLHLDLVQLSDTAPNGCFASVSYVDDMEQFAHQKHNVDAFVDPFEEEERRSRTEMWVESTSPGYASDDEPKQASVVESDESVAIPEVKVFACSEKSVSASPPGNTTTSTTGVDEELPTVHIQINDEVHPNTSKQKGMDRMDSLATSEMSEANSLVSSEMDKASLVKQRFNCNLHHAREDAKKEVDMENFDRFWRYLYNKSEPSEEREKKKRDEKREERNTGRRRGRTPTPSIERVVLYYTTDRRISMTPSVSSLSPSPTPNSQRSFILDSGRNLFIQSNKPAVTPQDSLSSEPLGDIMVPIVAQKSTAPPKSSVASKPVRDSVPPAATRKPISSQDSMSISLSSEPIGDIVVPTVRRPPSGSKPEKNRLQRALDHGIVIYESEEPTSSKEEAAAEAVKVESETPASTDQGERPESESSSAVERNLFFQLDELSGSDEPEEGRVDVKRHIYEVKLLPSPLTSENRLMDQSTSTADLPHVVRRQGRDDEAVAYKKAAQSDKSTVTTPPLDVQVVHSTKKQMLDQATSTSHSPTAPTVIFEDAPETDVSLPDFKDQLSDIDTSSLEDLLAMDTRPNSTNRKSVSFSDFIDVEIVSPEPQKKSPSPEFRNFTVKPILKNTSKQTESMRRLLDYAAERLYKDLLMLIEERDRSIHALELTPEDDDNVLSTRTCIFQKRYREKLLENKLALDKRIDQVWLKLKDMAVDGPVAEFVNGVRHSSELTLNVKRRLNIRRESLPAPKKNRSDIELVSDLSRRLSLVREQLMHGGDSGSIDDSPHSMEHMLTAVSRIISGQDRIAS